MKRIAFAAISCATLGAIYLWYNRPAIETPTSPQVQSTKQPTSTKSTATTHKHARQRLHHVAALQKASMARGKQQKPTMAQRDYAQHMQRIETQFLRADRSKRLKPATKQAITNKLQEIATRLKDRVAVRSFDCNGLECKAVFELTKFSAPKIAREAHRVRGVKCAYTAFARRSNKELLAYYHCEDAERIGATK